MEAFLNKATYLDHEQMSIGMGGEEMTMDVVQLYTQLSGCYDELNTWKDRTLIYNKLMFKYRKSGMEAQQWMLHMVANVTGLAIDSIWPWLPAAEAKNSFALMKRDVFNRVIYPTNVPWNRLRATIAVMWCHGSTKGKEPNHFVPVVP